MLTAAVTGIVLFVIVVALVRRAKLPVDWDKETREFECRLARRRAEKELYNG